MKTQLESIGGAQGQSFTMMVNPNLSDLHYWHYHPEYELVFIRAEQGIRHVGNHKSTYIESDLVLIGSNIPHLNFDYGLKTDYQKVVLHITKSFVEEVIEATPELSSISNLFEASKYGLAFGKSTKQQIGQRLFDMQHLEPFKKYVELLAVLQLLSGNGDVVRLHEQAYHIQFNNRDQERLQSVFAFIAENYGKKIRLEEVAIVANLSKEAFCRYFKHSTKYTFIEFLNRYRISKSKELLLAQKPISEACFHAGFQSLSYYNRIFKSVTGISPRAFISSMGL